MEQKAEIFETHYEDYLDRICQKDFSVIQRQLGLDLDEDCISIPFFNQNYTINKDGIKDAALKRPHYGICVIISQYLLRYPEVPVEHDATWVSFKDFKKFSSFSNDNFLKSDCEDVIAKLFSKNLKTLDEASKQLGGKVPNLDLAYDRAIQFDALPTISLLILFNDRDAMFPAECKILFQAQAENYLDPESLLMVAASLALFLKFISTA